MIKRKRHQEHENNERWLVSYADFITLMFAFFTVMYATAQRNPDKEKEFEKSVRKYFYSMVQSMGGKDGTADVDFGTQPIPPPIPMYKTNPESAAVEQKLKNMDESGGLSRAIEKVYHDAYGVRIRLLAATLFDSGSATPTEEGLQILKTLGEYLKDNKNKIIIEGHTDDRTINSSQFPSNWELSSARATKILRYLAEFYDIDSRQLVAVAYADSKPAYPNNSEKNRAKNRRIEILLTNYDAAGM